MHVLVAYDVSTTDADGPRRLHNVAQACTNYGQRVQQSVFECEVSRAQYEQLIDDLTGIIDEEKDSLRAYRLAQPTDETIETWGVDDTMDFDDPLIL
ncbi:MAG: CRISPR-associated endonuclease Cas2 [Bacteroidetes bacterium QS_3_64_15]|nr:MAG: CRISPR-associated endonuclease Cas2 [Bacteroidetes bacterium QS_3_64_15]